MTVSLCYKNYFQNKTNLSNPFLDFFFLDKVLGFFLFSTSHTYWLCKKKEKNGSEPYLQKKKKFCLVSKHSCKLSRLHGSQSAWGPHGSPAWAARLREARVSQATPPRSRGEAPTGGRGPTCLLSASAPGSRSLAPAALVRGADSTPRPPASGEE